MEGPRFVTGKPALMAGDSLVIADLHLGIEREFRKSGIRFPSQTGRIRDRIDRLIEETRPERLIFLGDVKHKVPGISLQEAREIPGFLKHFSDRLEVGIVPGNHDAGIEKYAPRAVKIHPATGIGVDGIFLNHGHAWPDPGFLRCGTIVLGHQHPMVEFKDKLMYRFVEPVWIRCRLSRAKLEERYKAVPRAMPEAVIMPAFNEIAGGIAMNSSQRSDSLDDYIGPLLRSVDKKTASAHMLDGTFLGKLMDLRDAKL
ncbi:MAG: metallophosphoesterase [Candidatus Aenigmarchaeota archaeon]|nr:metallophosphoesterase [Candidatus Aenigmarchaeota archaeon]